MRASAGEAVSSKENSMNDARHDRLIRKFNPGTFQSDEEIIKQFVVRENELDILLNVVRDNIDSTSCRHALIIGPHGQGKTMLLARISAELRMYHTLSEHLFPVRFTEENHEIAGIADFWFEALFHLAQANARRNPEFRRELLATHTDLAGGRLDPDIAHRTRSAFLDAANRLGRKVVLMVENLQALYKNTDDTFSLQLRETLQTVPEIMLLATATDRFPELDDPKGPFFDLFRIVELQPLSTDACGRLWTMAAGGRKPEPYIRPLQILTGGNPRLLAAAADFSRPQPENPLLEHDQLLETLVSLVDDFTEYFRRRLERLPKTERRVFIAVLDLWQPSTAAEIAARARMDIRNTAALLGRLVDRGTMVYQETGRQRKYATPEPLYNIYYKLRRERRGAESVRNLIRFMTVFYRSDEAAADAAYRDLLARLHLSDKKTLQVKGALLLLNKSMREILTGRPNEALQTCDEVDELLGKRDENEADIPPVLYWQADWKRAQALLVLNKVPEALRAFQSACTMFVPEDETMLREMLSRMPTLIAAGARESDLAAILEADVKRAETLAPLVAALRTRAGEPVCGSAEILEVAADVCSQIEHALHTPAPEMSPTPPS